MVKATNNGKNTKNKPKQIKEEDNNTQKKREVKKQDQNALSKQQQSKQQNWIQIQQITQQIDSKISETKNFLEDLHKFGMTKKQSQVSFTQKIYQSAQKAAIKTINTAVIDAQNSIFDNQREIFKRNSALQSSYGKLKNVLEECENFNDIQIDKIIQVVETKIEENKGTLTALDQIVKRGNVILNQKK